MSLLLCEDTKESPPSMNHSSHGHNVFLQCCHQCFKQMESTVLARQLEPPDLFLHTLCISELSYITCTTFTAVISLIFSFPSHHATRNIFITIFITQLFFFRVQMHQNLLNYFLHQHAASTYFSFPGDEGCTIIHNK